MPEFPIESFASIMQTSVSSAVMISAVGMILLSVTNRLGRTIDRSRIIVRELDQKEGGNREDSKLQLRILVRRAELLRLSVSFLVTSVFFSCLMILTLFLKNLSNIRLEEVIVSLFCLGLITLLTASAYLLSDIFLSLKALKIEVAHHLS